MIGKIKDIIVAKKIIYFVDEYNDKYEYVNKNSFTAMFDEEIDVKKVNFIHKICGKKSFKFKKIISLVNHSFGIDFDNNLYGWGLNDHGSLGLGIKFKIISPRSLNFKITKIFCGDIHTLIIDIDKSCLVFGKNFDHQLGMAVKYQKYYILPMLSGYKFIKAAVGLTHTIIIDNDGDTLVCGNNYFGQLGTGTTESEHVYAWGRNRGQLGVMQITDIFSPTKLVKKFKKIICNGDISLLVDPENEIYELNGYTEPTKTKYSMIGKKIHKLKNNLYKKLNCSPDVEIIF